MSDRTPDRLPELFRVEIPSPLKAIGVPLTQDTSRFCLEIVEGSETGLWTTHEGASAGFINTNKVRTFRKGHIVCVENLKLDQDMILYVSAPAQAKIEVEVYERAFG